MANVNITVSLQGMQAVQAGLANITRQLGAIQKQAAPGVGALGTQFRQMGVQAGYAAQGLAAAQRNMAAMQRVAVQTGAGIQRIQGFFGTLQGAATRVGTAFKGVGASFARFQQRALVSAAFFGLIGAAVTKAVGSLIAASDTYTMLSARLQIVSKNAAQNALHLKAIYEIAQDARVGLEAVGQTYQRIALNGARLGITQGQVAQITSTLSKALILSGSTAEEAANGMIQLTQAMSKGKLDGDELRSVFENMPLVVAEMEKATKRNRGELYKLASQGKITAEVLIGALLKAGLSVNAAFAKMPRTFGQAVTQLSNDWTMMVGKALTAQSSVGGFNKAIDELRRIITDPQFAASMANLTTRLANLAAGIASFLSDQFSDETQLSAINNQIANLEQNLEGLNLNSIRGMWSAAWDEVWGGPGGETETRQALENLKKIREGIQTAIAYQAALRKFQNLRPSHRDSFAKSELAATAIDTVIPAAKDKEAEARDRNLQIMTLENQVLQETIDGNYEEARALQAKVAILREGTDGADEATSAQIKLNQQLTFGAQVAAQLKGPYEQYKDTLTQLQAAQAAGVISSQQMAQAHVMAAATAVQPWLMVAETVGQAMTTMFGESQGVQIAVAIINTLAGITQALASYPPPLSYAMAAATAALGFAQVAKIKSTKPGSGSDASAGKAKSSGAKKPKKKATGGLIPGFGGGDIVPALLEPGEFIINKNATLRNRDTLQAINSNRIALPDLNEIVFNKTPDKKKDKKANQKNDKKTDKTDSRSRTVRGMLQQITSHRMAAGGVVGGFGSGDKIPAMLTPGEFVVSKDASTANRDLLVQINANRMASGGVVGGGKTSWSGDSNSGNTTIVFSGITAIDEIGVSRLERRLTKRGKRADYRRYGISS
jgi:tape measure domain-containing protein